MLLSMLSPVRTKTAFISLASYHHYTHSFPSSHSFDMKASLQGLVALVPFASYISSVAAGPGPGFFRMLFVLSPYIAE